MISLTRVNRRFHLLSKKDEFLNVLYQMQIPPTIKNAKPHYLTDRAYYLRLCQSGNVMFQQKRKRHDYPHLLLRYGYELYANEDNVYDDNVYVRNAYDELYILKSWERMAGTLISSCVLDVYFAGTELVLLKSDNTCHFTKGQNTISGVKTIVGGDQRFFLYITIRDELMLNVHNLSKSIDTRVKSAAFTNIYKSLFYLKYDQSIHQVTWNPRWQYKCLVDANVRHLKFNKSRVFYQDIFDNCFELHDTCKKSKVGSFPSDVTSQGHKCVFLQTGNISVDRNISF